MSDPFDHDALMERIDGDVEFLEETITMLDEDGPSLLEQVQAAATSGDVTALVESAHALKSMVGNFCADTAERAARELEEMGRENRLTDVDAAVDRLKRELEKLLKALHQFLRAKTE